jgi:hypothetical protein
MHRSGMQHALRLGVVFGLLCPRGRRGERPALGVRGLIVVSVALSWAAPGLRDERSFLPHSQQQHTDAS